MPYARVLVVDDIQTNLLVMKGLLTPYGLKADMVLSGKEAVERIRAETVRYDAVFMDHMMPEMDGIEAVRIIRTEINSEYALTVPVIALTANAIEGNRKMFLESGFNDFISKPVDIK
jgi:CheY-like chemotaxis protein